MTFFHTYMHILFFLAFNKSSKGNNPTVALLHTENRCLAHKTNIVTQKETIISKLMNSDL